jgi:arylsulfatase A-like enzyme
LTDNYAQASCTAGRAAFITGQIPMRTGLTTVGLPGAPQGIQPEDPTTPGTARRQPQAMVETVLQTAAQRQGN